MKSFVAFIEKYSLFLLTLWVFFLSVGYSLLSVLRHSHFQSGGFDFGIYDQAVWQYAHFIWPYNTIKDRFILGDHLTLSLPLLAPLILIWKDAIVLLIAQAVWIACSAFAAYGLAVHRKFLSWIALVLSVVYSLFYGIQYAVFFDFHPIVFGVGLLLWLAYFFETKRKKLFFVTLVLLLATQENMGISLAGLGLIYLFRKEYRSYAMLFIIGGISVSLISSRIIALISPVGFEYTPQINLNPAELIQRYIDSPEKRQVWLLTLSSFGLLPIFSPEAMAAVLLDLSQYFLAGDRFFPMWSPFKHHRAILAVFLVMGALEVFAMARKKGWNTGYLALWMVGLTLFFQFYFHFPLNKLVKAEYWKSEQWMTDNNKLIASVTEDASVATQQNLVPHLSHRKEIYLVWPRIHDFDDNRCGQRSCWWLDFSGKPQYLVVDTRPNQWLTQTLESPDHFLEAIANMQKTNKIQLVREVNAAKLFLITY